MRGTGWFGWWQGVAAAALLTVGCSSFGYSPLQTELYREHSLAALTSVVVLPFHAEPGRVDEFTAEQQSENLLSIMQVRTPFALLNVTEPGAVRSQLQGLKEGELFEQAQELGRAVQADGVLCGRITKFVPRKGSARGGSQLAAAGFQLALLDVRSGAVVWRAAYDATDGPLSENVLRISEAFSRGVGYKDAPELFRFGLEDALTQLDRAKSTPKD